VRKYLLAFTLTLAFVAAPLANAEVAFGSSSSTILSATMYSDNLGQQDLFIKALSNTAPAPYSTVYGPEAIAGSNSLFSFGAQTGTGGIESDVDGTPGDKIATGAASVLFYSFSMLDILSLSGDEMSVSVSSSGDALNFGASASVNISGNTALTVLGSAVDLTGGVIYNQDGLMILQQQHNQLVTDFGSANSSFNFLITFDNFLHNGDTLNGTILLGAASSDLRAVPEPSTMLVLGSLGLAAALRRRKKA
jgi:hypothetical protein